jgi:hypothetical protein
MVEADIRGEATEETKTYLRQEDMIDSWYVMLQKIHKNLESQLGARKASVYATTRPDERERRRAEYNSWKSKILRFKSGAEDRMLEAKSMRRSGWLREDVILEERNDALTTLRILRKAISTHQSEVTQPSEADKKLWGVL